MIYTAAKTEETTPGVLRNGTHKGEEGKPCTAKQSPHGLDSSQNHSESHCGQPQNKVTEHQSCLSLPPVFPEETISSFKPCLEDRESTQRASPIPVQN